MSRILFCLIFLVLPLLFSAQNQQQDSFRWGNAVYVNLTMGETVVVSENEIELIGISRQFAVLRVGADTLRMRVSRNSLPVSANKLRFFIADNRYLKENSVNKEVHGLLTGDALVCVSGADQPLLDPVKYKFPVDFTDGYQWSAEEENFLFTFLFQPDKQGKLMTFSNPGIDLDLNNSRMQEKNLIVAIENSTVTWIEENNPDQGKNEACVLLRSLSDPEIYYLYERLNNKKLFVRKGQKVDKGDEIGYAWGSGNWCSLRISVVKSGVIPEYGNRFRNVVGFFPQLLELYAGSLSVFQKTYSRGSLDFGKTESISGNIKNTLSFGDFSGKGWRLKEWNPADRIESITQGISGNARLRKTVFKGTAIECTNPDNYYDFEINVSPGVYRVRAEVGDAAEGSWQKIEFEGIAAGTIELPPGNFKWTSERAVKVNDGKLTVRINISPEKVAGISSLVFQKAY